MVVHHSTRGDSCTHAVLAQVVAVVEAEEVARLVSERCRTEWRSEVAGLYCR